MCAELLLGVKIVAFFTPISRVPNVLIVLEKSFVGGI